LLPARLLAAKLIVPPFLFLSAFGPIQVSGEYAALHAAAAAGVYDLRAAVIELSHAMARAGASIVLSYFTPELLDWLEA
jgi:delta-aminolevulinic acid dehydratase/porphobilinogen synthase